LSSAISSARPPPVRLLLVELGDQLGATAAQAASTWRASSAAPTWCASSAAAVPLELDLRDVFSRT
jgi:hypothetical protein